MTRSLGLALLWLMSTTAAIAVPYPSTCIQTITFAVPVNGQLTTSDCSYGLSSSILWYYDIYTFSGVAGQSIAISMTSPSLDADLYLYNVNDTSATPVAEDDDGGGGTNARIPAGSGWFTLPTTGTYYISAEAVDPSATGPYTITVNTAASLAVELNQHGLTGSWFEAATSGQGFEVEVFRDLSAPGTGLVQVSWFTYDTVVGGAERQRWYTLSGPVTSGQPTAALTIYQNTGGNFNAPPVTTAQPVGTATLSFDTCASGQLAYTFTDGTGRAGTIPLVRLLQNVTCSTTTPHPTNADFALSGNWFGGAATSGQGLTVEVNPNAGTFFAAWYTYLPNGAAAGTAGQRWYTAQATFTPALRSVPVTIYETTRGVFDTPTPPGQTTVPVGTGTMTYQSCSAATFSYTFTGGSSSGLSGTINLGRVGPVPPGCALTGY